ncbi:MAG: sigma-54 dependent transcriptional regulator [candidate division KSB1 bacterium]|nr:sigma-54 dependent transcriptional regulator [candidate division KSB1 bacterium]MDZ7303423.1 sigma-54 dependent transcriptional regulator [candidate division KSB1 bacterium]MDZ7312505.1 sigma-54 dependent transcriptional regulator [candidate division KSB1 bacterium]
MTTPLLKAGPSGRDINTLRQEIGLVGESPAIWQILETIEQVAPTDISVLIIGESGTGKELIAQAIHKLSHRHANPFVIVNAGAIPEGIIESELFGHEKGAFTGAVGARKGYFEQADTGTIFLDEIGEMPLNTQVKLLRLLEGKEFIRVGGSSPRQVDVRVITATNRDLEAAVRKGQFRSDLFYRLNAVNIRVPPLRERRQDVPLLVKKFVLDFCSQNNISFEGFTEGAMRMLMEHSWPGNIRELKNFVESLIVIERGRRIDETVLQRHFPRGVELDHRLPVPVNRTSEEVEREFIYRALIDLKNEIAQLRELLIGRYIMPPRRLKPGGHVDTPVLHDMGTEVPAEPSSDHENAFESIADMEKRLIVEALERTNGNKRKAANLLKISERTLYRKIKEYNLPF